MNASTFLRMSPAQRVEEVERIRQGIHELRVEDGGEVVDDLPLSEPSTTWLVRMRQALVDEDVTQDGFNELAGVFAGYRATLSLEEASELTRRIYEFDEAKQAVCKILDGDPG